VATLKTHKALTGLGIILLVAIVFSYFYPNTQAQTQQYFTPSDRFDIPKLNGSIKFANNGSFSSATLENDTWVFEDLRFNISRPQGNLKVSAQNSNMTIFSYQSLNFIGRSEFLRVEIQGQGKQTINLGLNLTRQTKGSEWSVIMPGSIFLAEGEGWKLLTDNTVVMTGLTGNFSVVHYNLGLYDDENLPFYQKHSIAIITAIVLALTVTISVAINFKGRK
jgi:hypothetical protein